MARTLEDIRSLARSFSPTAVRTLAGIMRQKKAPPLARIAACNSILDRAYGKAEQSHELNADIQITIRKLFDGDAQLVEVNPKQIDDKSK